MARKQKHEEHENHERWLVSYADFITLLFAFFVVMYSLSAINEGRFRILAESLKAAFQSKPMHYEPIPLGNITRPEILSTPDLRHNPGIPQSMTLVRDPFPQQRRMAGLSNSAGPTRTMREIADKMAQALAPLIEKDLVTVRRFRQWLEVEIKSNVLFPSGSARLQPDAIPVLRRIAGILHEYPNNRVQIEGFTDNVPIRTAAFPSNWELSTARSISVVRLFSAEGVNPARLAALGYGEHRPASPNDTEEGRRKNRKVVLVILADDNDAPRLRELASQNAAGEAVAQMPPSENAPDRNPPLGLMPEAVAASPLGDAGGATPGAATEEPSVVIVRPNAPRPPVRAPEAVAPSPVKPPLRAPLTDEKPIAPDRIINLPALPKPGG
jgi:chemotaxis protein MotB